MKITEKEMVHKALRCCRDGNSCQKCPYYAKRDCVEILEHKATELYISEHPEILNIKIEKADKVELIKCKDCTYFDYGVDVAWCCCHDVRMLDCDYCSRAIRKDDEE